MRFACNHEKASVGVTRYRRYLGVEVRILVLEDVLMPLKQYAFAGPSIFAATSAASL